MQARRHMLLGQHLFRRHIRQLPDQRRGTTRHSQLYHAQATTVPGRLVHHKAEDNRQRAAAGSTARAFQAADIRAQAALSSPRRHYRRAGANLRGRQSRTICPGTRTEASSTSNHRQ